MPSFDMQYVTERHLGHRTATVSGGSTPPLVVSVFLAPGEPLPPATLFSILGVRPQVIAVAGARRPNEPSTTFTAGGRTVTFRCPVRLSGF